METTPNYPACEMGIGVAYWRYVNPDDAYVIVTNGLYIQDIHKVPISIMDCRTLSIHSF